MLIHLLFVGSSWDDLSSIVIRASVQHPCQLADFVFRKRCPLYLLCKRLHLLEVWKAEFVHTIPMGSSNMGVVTAVDVEAQRHSANWFADHTHMLRPNQEAEANKLGYFISKVPEYMRQPPQEFSPQGWRFGLHNRENLDSSGSEAVKLGVALLYGFVGEKWVHFRDAIVDDPKTMLACYGLQNEMTSWTDEQIKHVLALDALFLVTLCDMQNEGRLWKRQMPFQFIAIDVFNERFNKWVSSLQDDLYKVENQIPLVLIDKVVEFISNFDASTTSVGNEQYQQRSLEFGVEQLLRSFMDCSGGAFKIDNRRLFRKKRHFLGAAYNVMCGSKGLHRKSSMVKSAQVHVPSATKLDKSGIEIVGVDEPLCAMSYDNNCLCLPKMKIYDPTISFLRNMAYYERTRDSGGDLLAEYISFMLDLIQAPEDMEFLVKRGVIDNNCGIRAFEMWTALEIGSGTPSYKIDNDMKAAIVSKCEHRRYRLWNEFKIVFCSKPWLVLSTFVVVLVTVATLVQTYISIIGSNKMKPKFP